MTYRASWLAKDLRAAGLAVIEEVGWQNRGHGDMGVIKGVLCHHTAGPRAGNAPSLNVVVKGRPGLAGPLANLFLARDGTYHTVAAGKAWHAGPGNWQGITQGNSQMIGIEAENTGLENDQPWPAKQMVAYVDGVAAVLKHIGAPAIMAAGHKEYATPRGRKIDPTFDMVQFRAAVAEALKHDGVTDETYTVVAGDTLWGIAHAHGISLDDLLLYNHLTLASVIHPGDILAVK